MVETTEIVPGTDCKVKLDPFIVVLATVSEPLATMLEPS